MGNAVAIRYSASDPAVWDIPTGVSAANTRFAMWGCFSAGGVSLTVLIAWIVTDLYIRRHWPELAPM
jgi:hypothetical protein